MTYTVHKQDNKAWLKEDAGMKEPICLDVGTYRYDTETYNKHIASRKEIQIAPEYVGYWSEGAKVGKGEFAIEERDRQDQYDNGEWARSYTTIQVAIPVQKDDDVNLKASATSYPSTWVELTHNDIEYHIEVFDDTVCVHIYRDGKKTKGSYFVEYKPLNTVQKDDEAGLSIDDLKRLRNYFGGHDKTSFEQWAYDILNKEIKRKQ